MQHPLHPAPRVPPVRLGPKQRRSSSSPHDRSTTGRTLHSPRQGHPAQHCPHTTAAAKARPILFKLRM